MKGIAIPNYNRLITPGESDENTLAVLLGCNSLLWVNQKLVGDPIELIVFKAAGGTISGNWISSSRKLKIHPLKRYSFDSVLKRMSVLVTFYSGTNPNEKINRILTKGAPETMKEFFKDLPKDYDEIYNKYAKQGFRILATGYRDSSAFNATTKRDEIEKDLTFCGFIIVETPLKHDSEKYMKELKESGFGMCIITGDHHLTTAKVSQDCGIGPNEILFLRIVAKKGEEDLIETSKAISNI